MSCTFITSRISVRSARGWPGSTVVKSRLRINFKTFLRYICKSLGQAQVKYRVLLEREVVEERQGKGISIIRSSLSSSHFMEKVKVVPRPRVCRRTVLNFLLSLRASSFHSVGAGRENFHYLRTDFSSLPISYVFYVSLAFPFLQPPITTLLAS
jgi:hypothetical protein